jgi:hypothetical protein
MVSNTYSATEVSWHYSQHEFDRTERDNSNVLEWAGSVDGALPEIELAEGRQA